MQSKGNLVAKKHQLFLVIVPEWKKRDKGGKIPSKGKG